MLHLQSCTHAFRMGVKDAGSEVGVCRTLSSFQAHSTVDGLGITPYPHPYQTRTWPMVQVLVTHHTQSQDFWELAGEPGRGRRTLWRDLIQGHLQLLQLRRSLSNGERDSGGALVSEARVVEVQHLRVRGYAWWSGGGSMD